MPAMESTCRKYLCQRSLENSLAISQINLAERNLIIVFSGSKQILDITFI